MTDQTLKTHSEDTAMLHEPGATGGAAPWFAVFKRELALYFRSPIAYGIGFAVFMILGVLFNAYLASANGQATADQIPSMPGLITFLMFLIAPLITMRLLAEESREGTLEVLMTLPMNESQFIVGKFLAAWAYYTVLILLSLIYHIILSSIGIPDQGIAFGTYLGAWLYGGAVLAIALIWSAITEDQIVAAFLGAGTILVLYLAEAAAEVFARTNSALGDFVRELGLRSHYEATMAVGIIRAEDVLYFLLVIVGALFITTRIVETRRWRA